MPSNNYSRGGFVHLGLDVSKDSIAVGILRPDEVVADVEMIANQESSIRRLISRFEDRKLLRTCYEAGPTGYELHRLLSSIGVANDVIAPSLMPRIPGDHVKTDRRDANRLARLHRAGELTPIRVPSKAEEGVRDLCRARGVAVEERRRSRQRLGSFLLRHNQIFRETMHWTQAHQSWIAGLSFDDKATQSALSFYRSVLVSCDAILASTTAELAQYYDSTLFGDPVHRLSAYRGIDSLGALTIICEVCDYQRFWAFCKKSSPTGCNWSG